jgi:hypothetical protein
MSTKKWQMIRRLAILAGLVLANGIIAQSTLASDWDFQKCVYGENPVSGSGAPCTEYCAFGWFDCGGECDEADGSLTLNSEREEP